LYDVLYRDRSHTEQTIASGLAREAACELARSEARRRSVGRMFAAGSDPVSIGDVVLIVDSKSHAAA
jgi:hypothetical protein